MATSFTSTTKKLRREDALSYHSEGRPGKIEVRPTKPTATARDLALAYSPGVAYACLAETIVRLAGGKARLRFDPSKPSGQPRRACDTRKAARRFEEPPERRAVEDSAYRAKASEVYLVEEAVAAATVRFRQIKEAYELLETEADEADKSGSAA